MCPPSGGICAHGRRKSRCKECGVCAHGRPKQQCDDRPQSSTSEPQSSSAAPRAASCATADGGDAHARDTLLAELRAWVGGLERIGDAEQVVALLLQGEVSLANLGLFTVDELAGTGVGEAAACELLSQFMCRGAALQT